MMQEYECISYKARDIPPDDTVVQAAVVHNLAAISERLERMVEEEAQFHIKLLELLEKRLLGIQNATTGR